MKNATLLLLALVPIFIVSCSSSGEANTPVGQEKEFRNAFGFAPPPAITSINYADLSNRGVMNGAYGQWLSFTYDESTFEKIVESGYSSTSSMSLPNGEASPKWWPVKVAEGAALFSRTHEDTPEDEGFSFEEFLWYDESLGQVFFHKFYWG